MGHNRDGDVRVIWRERFEERCRAWPAAMDQEQNDEGGKSKLTHLHKDSQAKLSSMCRALTTVGVHVIQRGGCSRITVGNERPSTQQV